MATTHYDPRNHTFQSREKMLANRIVKIENISSKFSATKKMTLRVILAETESSLNALRAQMKMLDL